MKILILAIAILLGLTLPSAAQNAPDFSTVKTEKGIFDDVYTGNFSNDQYNGKGKMTYSDGSVYLGDFVDGRIE